MTNPASGAARAGHPATVPTGLPVEGLLHLDGTRPEAVYVGAFWDEVTQDWIPGFAHRLDGVYHREGIKWKPERGSEYAKFVTFNLLPSVDEIKCDLAYSEKYENPPPALDGVVLPLLDMCIPHASWEATFHFGIVLSDVTGTPGAKTTIDPKIVVTPIGT